MPQRQKMAEIRVYNKGKQLVPLHVRPPQGDFYLHEQQVRLRPGQHVMLPKEYVNMHQVTNLSARGILKVMYDSEAA